MIDSTVIVRDHRAGVHVGTLTELDPAAKTCRLTNARKIWYWVGAASCHGLAAKGLRYDGSKVCPVVEEVALLDVVELVRCSEKGAAVLSDAPVWNP